MLAMYHSDIVPRITMGFTYHHDNPQTAIKELTNVANSKLHEVEVNKPSGMDPITTVGSGIMGFLALNNQIYTKVHDVELQEFQPENINNENVRNMLLQMCSRGRFVPFILTVSMDDIRTCVDSNMIYILAGFGQNADRNFVVIQGNLVEIVKELKLSYIPGSTDVNLIYPIVFDVSTGVIGSVLSENSLTIRSYIQK